MADDGMLLNFELPSNAFAPKQSFKGGSWRDRLKAKKSANNKRGGDNEHRPGKTIPRFEEVRSEDEELILPGAQPNKRQKIDSAQISQPLSSKDGDVPTRQAGPRKSLPSSFDREVISSLFTFNPTSTNTKIEPQPVEDDTVEASNAPLRDELATFTNLGLSTILANHLLHKLEIKAPTAIQRQAIARICSSDKDAFVQAETGSGKTLAYLLPILERITQMSKKMKANEQSFSRTSGLFAIILAPTRELSKQINVVLENLLICAPWIVGGIVIGGEKKKSEKARLRKGVNILVATPGRLADHLEHTEVLDVSLVRWLVLDEGDRLMELGFEQDIQKIVSVLNLRSRKVQGRSIEGLPERRTTILCSATLKADVEQLRSIALKDAVAISVDPTQISTSAAAGQPESAFSAPAQLKQSYALVPPKQRLVTLVATLRQTFRRKGSVMKCIVFISCADSVDFHFDMLSQGDDEKNGTGSDSEDAAIITEKPEPTKLNRPRKGAQDMESRTQARGSAFSSKQNPAQIFRLHGSLQQALRTSTLKAFTKCTDAAVLFCTDVASRGLDLPNVDLVIEYDPAFSRDEHLHRIGRTARAGKDGRAMVFLMPGCEEGYVDVLKDGRSRHLTKHDADDLLKKGFNATSGVVAGNRSWEDAATEWQLEIERWVLSNPKHQEQARRAFQSHVRAYATHVAAERKIFDMQQLHLGHLAKAFALRDKPSSLRVPGLRPGNVAKGKAKNDRRTQDGAAERSRSGDDFDPRDATEEVSARRKMQAKMRTLGGVSEFNLG